MQSPERYRPEVIPAAPVDSARSAAELLAGASRPVIVAGGGVKNSDNVSHVLSLAERLDAPIVTSPGHGDAVPFGHPLNAGQMGPRGNKVASRLVNEADVILALGTRLGFNSTFYSYDNLNAEAKIIQVEIEPTALGRYFPVELGIWSDAATAARQISEALDYNRNFLAAEGWATAFKDERAEFLRQRDSEVDLTQHPIQPSALFHELRGTLPKGCAVTMDAGTLCLQATDALNFDRPRSFFTPLDFGLVGFSFACGLGVKLACPDRPVVSLMGDGGFGMTVSELATAVQYKINTVTIVMNNSCWGAEKAYQRDFFGERYIGADLSNPPFDKLAELYGAKGYRVERITDLGDTLRAALDCGKPAVIDVMVDPAALYSFRRDSFQHRVSRN